MGLLPKDIELLPPYDDRIFKAFLTLPGSEPALRFLASAIINRPVVNVLVRNTELPVTDTEEKAERFDMNCKIDDDTQADIEMQSSRMKEEGLAVAGELLMSISKDERERAIFRNRRIATADRESNMAQAVLNERGKWQGVVAEKDTTIAGQAARIAELEARLGEGK